MSQQPISLSPDLKRLDDEGYEIEIRDGYLLLHSVPYVDEQARILRGTLASSLTLAGDIAAPPQDHGSLRIAGPTDQVVTLVPYITEVIGPRGNRSELSRVLGARPARVVAGALSGAATFSRGWS